MKHLSLSPRRLSVLAVALLPVAALLWLGSRLLPSSEADMRRAVCLVDGVAQLCVVMDSDTTVVWTDSVHTEGVWVADSWWRPGTGRSILTVQPCNPFIQRLAADSVPALIATQTDSLQRLLQRKEIERKELAYYLRCHGVQDDGYQHIAEYAERQFVELDSLQHIYNALNTLASRQHAQLVQRSRCSASWTDAAGRLQHVACRPTVTPVAPADPLLTLHPISDSRTVGAHVVRSLPWAAHLLPSSIIAVKAVGNDTTLLTLLVPATASDSTHHDLPHLFAADGSPVFSSRGWFVGVMAGGNIRLSKK